MAKKNQMQCRQLECDGFPRADHPVWKEADSCSLVDVVTGEKPFLGTQFSVFRCDREQRIYFLFQGEDDRIQSSFRWRDETLYREDVFEVFIADNNDVSHYIELEASPHSVLFDGFISYDEEGNCHLDMSFDITEWRVETRYVEKKNHITSVWSLPYAAFSTPPEAGKSWRINAFRIDHSERGESLQAWQKTGEANFHVPDAFGYLEFV